MSVICNVCTDVTGPLTLSIIIIIIIACYSFNKPFCQMAVRHEMSLMSTLSTKGGGNRGGGCNIASGTFI